MYRASLGEGTEGCSMGLTLGTASDPPGATPWLRRQISVCISHQPNQFLADNRTQ